MGTAVGGTFLIFLVILALIIAVLWIFMPFAIFGSKDLLKELIREQRKTNELLASIAKQQGAAGAGGRVEPHF